MRRRGFSMLEILLALAILGGSLAVLSQIVGTGADSAAAARDLAMAQLICQSKLAETILTGTTPVTIPPTPTSAPDSEATTAFSYAVEVAAAPTPGMLAIRVSVEAGGDNGGVSTASYSLTRWIIDPALGLAQAEADAKAAKEAETAP